jgi:pimeloyl-ACP methyl ester carboxylesterase
MGAVMFATEEAISGSILKEIKKSILGLEAKSDDRSKQQARLFTMLLNEPHITVENLKQIQAPVLVMAGVKDMVLEKHTKYIAANIPSSQLVIFEGATHYAPVEIVAEFNSRLKAFLE